MFTTPHEKAIICKIDELEKIVYERYGDFYEYDPKAWGDPMVEKLRGLYADLQTLHERGGY